MAAPEAPEVATDFRILMRLEGVPVAKRKKHYRRKGRCAKCGVHGSLVMMTVDHIVPQSRLRHYPKIKNHPANKQTLCAPCNNDKGHGPAIDYRGDRHLYDLLNRLLAQAGLNIKVFMQLTDAA